MKTTVQELSDLKNRLGEARREHRRLFQEVNSALGYVMDEPDFEASLKLHNALNDRLAEMVKTTGEKPAPQPFDNHGIHIPGQVIADSFDDDRDIYIPF